MHFFYLFFPLPALVGLMFLNPSLMPQNSSWSAWAILGCFVLFCIGLADVVKRALLAMNAVAPFMVLSALGFFFFMDTPRLVLFNPAWFGAVLMIILFAGGVMALGCRLRARL